MITPDESEYTLLPPVELISQITTFKFFQDSIKSVYQSSSSYSAATSQFKLQIIISQLSSSQVVYAWTQQRSTSDSSSGEIEKVLKSKAEEIQAISYNFIENAKLLGGETNLIRVNYNGNRNELFVLPDFEADLGITLIIEK